VLVVPSLTDPSENHDWQIAAIPDAEESQVPINHEKQNGLADQRPTAPRSRKRAHSVTTPTAKAVSPRLSKADKRSALRFHLIGAADGSCDEARNLLASLDDPPLEVIDGLPSPAPANKSNSSPEIAGVVLDGVELQGLEEIQKLDQSSPRPVVLALIKERSPASMRRALRAGADEVLFMPLERNDVTRALLKVTEARRRAEHNSSLGRICSFTSLTGGAGVTTLSASFALALSHRCQKRVGLLDLNLQSGGLGVFLNLDPEHTISMLTDERRAMDSIQLESTLARHDSGLHLLAAPKRVEESEGICEATVTAVLDLMRQLFDFVVVDCGSHINENVATAWERSEHLFYVVDQSIAAARSAVRFIDLFSRLHMEVQPAFILNRFDARRPVTEELISRTLARPLDGKIANDDKAIERSQMNGRDLWQTAAGSPLVRGVEDLARKVVAEGQPPEPRGRHKRLVGRIFGALRR
jgi:pilus assembly protein CpaE